MTAARLYHLAYIDDRDGEATFATSYPVTHETAEIIRRKLAEPRDKRTRIVFLETPPPPASTPVGARWRAPGGTWRVVRGHEYQGREHAYTVEYAREIRAGRVTYLLERVTPDELDAWRAAEGGES